MKIVLIWLMMGFVIIIKIANSVIKTLKDYIILFDTKHNHVINFLNLKIINAKEAKHVRFIMVMKIKDHMKAI